MLSLSTFYFLFSVSLLVKADQDPCSDINNYSNFVYDQAEGCKNSISDTWNQISKANTTNKEQLGSLQKRIAALKSQLDNLSLQLNKKQVEIKSRGDKMDEEYRQLSVAIRSFYIENHRSNLLTLILSSHDANEAFRLVGFYSFLSKRNRDTIVNLVNEISDLEKEKTQISGIIAQTTGLKAQIDQKANFLAGEVAKANVYEQQLQSQIAALSARQKDILGQRLASLNISRSAASIGRCDSDLTNGRDPGFSPKFAVFTYGVPNRVGMNQYGAWGRAKANQNEIQILQAYYNYDEIKKWDNIEIRVDGVGNYKLEDYVKRLYEIPDSWTDNNLAALKAQAIAARSYALAYTNNGQNSICATESCQVIKSEPKGGNWEQAVNQTEGQVMVQGGNPIKAWFSSTHGGYIFSSGEIGWNSTSWTKHATDASGNIGSFSDLQSNSYDRESPWFYCDWGSRSQYNKTAWLKPEELADIVNVLMLVKRDSGTAEHLYQTDKPNPAHTDTWDSEKVKQELRNRGGSPYNTVSDVSVGVDFGFGRTTNVVVSGDGGQNTFDAADFKDYFNLRAPATIQIVGPLFNIEKK